jgi:hypothetical protein
MKRAAPFKNPNLRNSDNRGTVACQAAGKVTQFMPAKPLTLEVIVGVSSVTMWKRGGHKH